MTSIFNRKAIKQAEEDQPDYLDKPTGLWRGAWSRLMRRKGGVIGLGIVFLMIGMAVFAPIIAPYDPNQDLIDTGVGRREPPCIHLFGCDPEEPQHIMGTDGNFRDEFSRVVYGARVSLFVGFTTVLFADYRDIALENAAVQWEAAGMTEEQIDQINQEIRKKRAEIKR